MYISQNCCKTQGLRSAFINSINLDRNYNIKTLSKFDKDLAKKYVDAKKYGGSLKSFWQKVKKFSKKVINSPAKIASKIYPYMKKGIDFLAKNPTAKSIISAIPKVGPAINVGLESASKLTDGVDKIIHSIQEKNPNVALSEAKNLVTGIGQTVKDVTNATNLTQEQKDKITNNVDKVYNALPGLIKSEGLDKVQKAAGYLPFINPSEIVTKELKNKKGGVSEAVRVKKPLMITKHPELFKRWATYNPKTVGELAGRVFLKGSGRVGLAGEEKEGCGDKAGTLTKTISTKDVKMKDKKDKKEKEESASDIIARLRKRIGKE